MTTTDPCAELNWSDVLPTGTVTLLLADVESSTRLWEAGPEEMTAAFARLDRALADLIVAHGGARPVEQGEGDSFVLAFPRASDAVGCALQLQRLPLAPIRLRIGVHSGEVQLRDEGNYIGPTINKTARLRDLAHGGQTVLSGATQILVEDMLPPDAWLTDLGSHELRGVARPERVVQLCHPDLGNDFPPLRSAKKAAVEQLPVELTTFVGRANEMNEVRQLLVGNRLVSLTGAGGAGKTRLAVEVATGLAPEYAGGICYVDLAPITDPDLVPVATGRALGLTDQPGRPMTEAIVRSVGDRQTLVVLDNCEHLLDACAALTAEVLGACPQLTFLATSREPIGVAGEVTWNVPSLSLADEAIELFTDRAHRARPDFTVDSRNISAVHEICRRLDGMPLAIELAAARVRALSLDEIVESLHDRFRLLTGGSRTAVRRQQTLRASVDWSHALLTDPERILFRRLAVFVGGFELRASQAIAGNSEIERFQVFDQLALLVDKSLVVAENTGGCTRYRMLETVRQYALEKLGESGEADAVRSRHCDYYTAMATALDGPGHSGYEERLQQADNEIDNLRAAFWWSRESSDTARASSLAASLEPLWLARGRVREGLSWLEAVRSDERQGCVSPEMRVRTFAAMTTILGWIGTASSVEEAEQALAAARDIGEPGLLVRALIARGCASLHAADVAERYFLEAADLARQIGDMWMLSQALGRQANIAVIAGDPRGRAAAAAAEALPVADAIGDRFISRHCRWILGFTRTVQGDLGAALDLFGAVVEEATTERDAMFRVYGLVMQSYVFAYQGDSSAARAAAEASLQACAELVEMYEGACHAAIEAACLAGGDVESARRAGEAARGRFGVDPAMSGIYMWSALPPLLVGDVDTARRWADEVVSLTRGWFQVAALMVRARVEIALGEMGKAERDTHDALAGAAELNGYLVVPYLLECAADVAAYAESYREAVRLLGAAEAAWSRTGAVRIKALDNDYHDLVDRLRLALDDNDFDSCWADGAALSIDESIAYAQRGRGERKRPASGWASLTPAELDVVRLVSAGLANKEIAARLFVSPRTVETHLSHVYTKLGFKSRVQLAQDFASHVGMTSREPREIR